MRGLSHLFVLVTLALACGSTQAQSTAAGAAPSGTSIRVTNADGTAITPTYQDAKGNVIDAQAFVKATQQGLQFEMKPSAKGEAVVFALLPRGANGGTSLTASGEARLGVGEPLPAFDLHTLAGGKASTTALAGKNVLVDFFFADCVACIEELPALNTYATQHPSMHFLAVTFDDAGTARGFVQKRHFAWPVAYNGKPLIDKLAITSFPTLLLLDKDGYLLAQHGGSIPVSVTQSAASSGKPMPSEPDVSVSKRAQLRWLEHWVDESIASTGR